MNSQVTFATRVRSGLTLIELAVTLAILGLLAALVLPAIQYARESSRRAQCSNNLRNIGQATHNFLSTHQTFPAGWGPELEPGRSGLGWSPLARIAGELGMPEIAARFDFTQPRFSEGDPELTATPLPVLRCPSDSLARGTNYIGCAGVLVYSLNFDKGQDGLFSSVAGRKSSEIADGMSHTAAFSERLGSPDPNSFSTRTDAWFSGALLIGIQDSEAFVQACNTTNGSPRAYFPFVGEDWFASGLGSSLYTHVVPPNSSNVNCFGEMPDLPGPQRFNSGGSSLGVMKASSEHAGGVSLLLADGSVHFIANEINKLVWQALGTIDERR